jgi:hypothetical protein
MDTALVGRTLGLFSGSKGPHGLFADEMAMGVADCRIFFAAVKQRLPEGRRFHVRP